MVDSYIIQEKGTYKYQRNIVNVEKILVFLFKEYSMGKINNLVLSKGSETLLLTEENNYLHNIIINEDLGTVKK